MAFLCPSGLGRSKQRRELQSSILERIYDGVEYDPMLQFEVGKTKSQNPDALRIVLHNFTACSREELTVRQGQKVHIIFREGDWVYVVNSDKKEGFIPFTACAKIIIAPSKNIQKSNEETVEPNKTRQTDRVNNNTYNVKKSIIVHQEPSQNLDNSFYSEFTDDSFITSDWSNHTHKHHALKNKHGPQSGERYDDNKNIIKSFFESTPYEKLPKFLEIFSSIPTSEITGQRSSEELSPRDRNWSSDPNESSFVSEGSTEYLDDTYITLFDFRGRHHDDVDIRQDEMITVLDKSDPFWYWIKKQDGGEGYVPSNYIGHTHDPKVATLIGKRRKKIDSTGTQDQMSPRSDDCYHGSPLSETSSVTSSNLNSETKQRPPKPPRTRKQTPRDPVKANRKQSSQDHQPSPTSKRESNGKSSSAKNSSKRSAHHLSLENISLETRHHAEHGANADPTGTTALKHRRNTSSRHRRPNYREYRSNSQRSYTFEESSDYFDAYFCDEPDPNFKKSSTDKDNVINVSEILKSRNPPSAGLLKSSSHKNTWMKSGSNDHGHNILNLRQFMQTLPSTEIGNDNNTNHSDKSDQNLKSNADKHSHGNQSRKVDWSFGYPRKIRSNQNSISSSSQAIHKQEGAKLRLSESSSAIQTKKHVIKQDNHVVENISREVKSVGSQTDLNDISVQVPDMDNPSDQMFLDLLSATDNLLEVSEKILTDRKAMKRTNVKVYDTGSDRRSSSSETNDDVDEKCSHFIMNQVIDTDIGQLTNRSEESVNVLSDFSEYSHIESNSEVTEHTNEVVSSVADQHTDTISNDSKSAHEDVETVIYANMRTSSSDGQAHRVSENSTSVINAIRNNSDKSSTSLNHEVFETSSKVSPKASDSDCVFDNATNVHGVTEFVVQYDYEPDSDMALPILKNEILHISLDIQEDDHWYWAYSPRLRCYGYVPKQYVKIPLVTII